MTDFAPLQFIQVTKSFSNSKTSTPAIQDLSFSLKPGGITALLGPDGAGKTTLIRLAAGLLKPNEGQVLVYGQDSIKNPTALQNEIGYMPQHFGLYEDLTVKENLDLYANLQGLTSQENQSRKQELYKLTGLEPFASFRAADLSGGMKQKLGLSCALLRAPRLLLLDEPTVGVDPISRRELWHILQDIKTKGGTILFSTAYFDEAERSDEIILLHEGCLLKKQTLAQFCDPLINHTYLVRSTKLSPRNLQQELRTRPQVIDVRITAKGNRVLCADTEPHPQDNEEWQNVPPSFEDAFVTLLGKTAAMQDGHYTPVKSLSINPQAQDGVIIEIKNLNRYFGRFQAVKNVSFNVAKGEIFGLLGANGAGKTTTFRMLCGLLRPSSGSLRVDKMDMHNAPAKARTRIGYVSQKFSLYGTLNLAQNLRFFAAAYGLQGEKKKARLAWALDEFQLTEYQQFNVDMLPLGIKQRLALACALIHEPPILFLDEPTSGVDPLARREFWQRIDELAAKGVTILITTHFMDEAEYCDHLVLMSLGEILAQGSPEEIRAKARNAEHPEPNMNDAFIYLIQQHEIKNEVSS